jgi:hypothetical protein
LTRDGRTEKSKGLRKSGRTIGSVACVGGEGDDGLFIVRLRVCDVLIVRL